MKIKVNYGIAVTVMLSLLIITVGADNARGNSPEEFKLSAGSYADCNHEFGHSVDISGDVAVVGSPGGEAAAAYVFRYNGTEWDLEARLIAPSSSSPVYFGWDVATSGNTVVVSAFDYGWSYDGSVYVFTRNGESWDEGQELISGYGVGTSVAIDGNTILVGEVVAGLVHVFTNHNDGNGWQQETESISLPPELVAPFFGWALDLSGDTAVVGAPFAGLAYVFARDGDSWDEGQVLVRGDTEHQVGSSVAIDGETVVVGAPSLTLPLTSQPPQGPGSAYVFRKDDNGSWQPQELPNPDVDGFGASVAISGDRLFVGAPTDDVACPDDQSCNSDSIQRFYYDGTSWIQDPLQPTLTSTLEPPLGANDQFGLALAIDGSRMAVGAPFGDVFDGEPPDATIISDAGAAHVFTLAPPNQPPIADAGPDQVVVEGDLVELYGSSDPDNNEFTFAWEQIGEPNVELAAANTKNPTFLAQPVEDGCMQLTFQLTVEDAGELTSTDTVGITVTPNNKIYARAGGKHRHGSHGHKYTFDGSYGDGITIRLEADPDGWHRGEKATLILKDKTRGGQLLETKKGSLPLDISTTLEADGKYEVHVFKKPRSRSWRHNTFEGDYILTLEGTCGKLGTSHRSKKK